MGVLPRVFPCYSDFGAVAVKERGGAVVFRLYAEVVGFRRLKRDASGAVVALGKVESREI